MAESTAVPAQPDDALQELDEAKVSAFQWKIMFVSGTGFFTDAYDPFVIGIVVAILTKQWHLSTNEISLVSSTTLGASAVGAVVFGRVADILGRKRIYGYEVLILGFGALASAFSPNVCWLIVFRIILGIGIGGDYPALTFWRAHPSGPCEPTASGPVSGNMTPMRMGREASPPQLALNPATRATTTVATRASPLPHRIFGPYQEATAAPLEAPFLMGQFQWARRLRFEQ